MVAPGGVRKHNVNVYSPVSQRLRETPLSSADILECYRHLQSELDGRLGNGSVNADLRFRTVYKRSDQVCRALSQDNHQQVKE